MGKKAKNQGARSAALNAVKRETSSGRGKTLLVVDGSSCIYRAFHAIPLFTTRAGLPTNAVYGFVQTLRKLIKTLEPDYIAVAFDVKGPSFRHGLYERYKEERPAMPEDLVGQIPYIKDMVRALNIPALESGGFEADDVIATLEKRFSTPSQAGEALRIVVATGDKDMLQLVKPGTSVFDHARDREYGVEEVTEKFGVPPERIIDLLGLAGDTSDGIPGVRGIGVKTAAKLIGEFGSIDEIFNKIEQVKPDKLRENLKSNRDSALLSRELATLHTDVPLPALEDDRDRALSSLELCEPDFERLEPMLMELEFSKLLKELIPVSTAHPVKSVTVEDRAALDALCASIAKKGFLSVFVHGQGQAGGAGGAAACCGLGVSLEPESGFFVPFKEATGRGLSEGAVLSCLKQVLEDPGVSIYTHEAKALYLYLAKRGVRAKGLAVDTAVASYLLDPTRSGYNLPDVACEHLGRRVLADEAPSLPPGADLFDGVSGDVPAKAACVTTLAPVLLEKLEKEGLTKLFETIEMPLVEVLARMELAGVRLERERLIELSKEMEGRIFSLTESIYKSAGYEFNINSPKQLSELLFERLGLRPVKKTKTGFSTDESVLEALACEHPVPRDIMKYRQTSKLKGTYVDSLLSLIDPATGRVHTSFNQTVTATGRLSSSNPNLQNIPVRGEYAARIREAFVAGPGFCLLSADYSQIELRLVAHFSGDPVLVDSFLRGEDVHTRTACEVFGIMPGLVTPEMRRRAKAINFGIIYGMGPHGLAAELSISMKEAKAYIDAYFARYKKVAEFIAGTIEEARQRGYTETIFGRRRRVPELSAGTEQALRFGERIAVNTPIQGSAADIIKAAMIGLDRELSSAATASRMLLQIHDELILEVADSELERVREMVREEMEGVVSLRVPIKVNIGVGANWQEV